MLLAIVRLLHNAGIFCATPCSVEHGIETTRLRALERNAPRAPASGARRKYTQKLSCPARAGRSGDPL